jgi:TonB family protein
MPHSVRELPYRFKSSNRIWRVSLLLGSLLFLLLIARGEASPVFQSATNQGPRAAGIEMLSDTEGLDFNDILFHLYRSIRTKWLANMPDPVNKGAKGKVVIFLQVKRDGTLSDSSPRIEQSSGDKTLDEHAVASIRAAAPFDHAPAAYSKPTMDLRMTFVYNMPMPNH